MNKKTILLGLSLVFIIVQMTPALATMNDETTTLEIIGIQGGFGGVTVEVKNTGDQVATDVSVITHVNGGFLNNIDITHECTGCSVCGTTLDPGAVKEENTMEAGILLGIGPIVITTTAFASNAPEVSDETTGFAIGPLVIIN